MRLALLCLTLVPALGTAQVWEKMVSPGVVYRMEVDTDRPLVIHAIRFAREAASLKAQTELASGITAGREDERKGRAPLTETIEKYEALAGVNGDFFPWTGDPMGAMVRDGELVSKPFRGRSVFGWGPGYSGVGRLTWKATASFTGQQNIKIDGLNEPCTNDALVLNTSAAGYGLAEGPSITAVLALDGAVAPNGEVKGKVLTIIENEKRVPVGPGQALLTAKGKVMETMKFLAKDEVVTIKTVTSGLDFAKAKNAVGGGPVIVADGRPLQAWDAENFNSDFALKRHPRTAIGATPLGDVWLVIVEGRQTLSVGATIDELAKIMARLGCTDAINLDGGGSSELALSGMVVNRPSDGVERPIANSILIFEKKKAEPNDIDLVIQGKPRLTIGSATDYRVVDSKGRQVPTSSIVWAAQGDAWIDQSGRLRPIQAGRAKVKAWVKGKVVTIDVAIETTDDGH